jgi:hypothetical protein
MHEHTNFHRQAIRQGLIEWISDQPFTHCLTLNSDRELAEAKLRKIFGTFCAKVDRAVHGRQRVYKMPAAERFHAIGFPERLSTNAHLHVLGDLSAFKGRNPASVSLNEVIRCCWLQSTRGAGSVDVQALRSGGFARYATKGVTGSDPTYFLAADYHPL